MVFHRAFSRCRENGALKDVSAGGLTLRELPLPKAQKHIVGPRCAGEKITPAAALLCRVSDRREKDVEHKSNGRPLDRPAHAGHRSGNIRCGPLPPPSMTGEAVRLPRR